MIFRSQAKISDLLKQSDRARSDCFNIVGLLCACAWAEIYVHLSSIPYIARETFHFILSLIVSSTYFYYRLYDGLETLLLLSSEYITARQLLFYIHTEYWDIIHITYSADLFVSPPSA